MKMILRTFSIAITTLLISYGMVSEADALWMLALFTATPFILYIVHSVVPSAPAGLPQNLRNLSVFFFTVVLLIGAQLAHYQFAVADSMNQAVLTTAEGDVLRNPRILVEERLILRGRMLDREGIELAGSRTTETGTVERTYAYPGLSSILGYYSPLMYGASSLEAAYDAELRGEVDANPLVYWGNRFLHRPRKGNDLLLTLDLDLQRAAREALGDRTGAVVALNPRDGAVLAMVSNPSYDSSRLFVPVGEEDSERAGDVARYWKELQEDEGKPFLNRAIQGLYPPGSTFKTVTLGAALDSGAVTASTVLTDTGVLEIEGYRIVEVNRPKPARSQYTVSEAYIYSLNVVFARLGLMVGPEELSKYAEAFGFGRSIPFDLPVARSQLSSTPEFVTNRVALADTAYGQGEVLATPLQMALVAASIANDGIVPEPYIVSAIRSPLGDTIYKHQLKELGRPLQLAAVQEVQRAMVRSVQEGWARPAQIPGVRVAGKSGTAEAEGQAPHAWFIAYAPADDPQIAVAVVVEHGGGGVEVALPVARRVIEAWMYGP